MSTILATQAADRQRLAHRPGTQKGRASAVRLLFAFCEQARLHYKKLSYCHACWFIEYMARAKYTPGSISNVVSHIRTFYKLAGLKDEHWHHYRVGLAMRAVAISIRHVPNPKDPVSPEILRAALGKISVAKAPLETRLAVLLMFIGFLRQSSIAPNTVAQFDPTRHLTPEDLTPSARGLIVKVKWTKTIQRAADAKSLLLPTTADAALCPLRAYKAYIQARAPPPAGPLLILEDGNPVTTRFIARQWALMLDAAALDRKKYSLHSLRRGAAGYTYNNQRADLNDVMVQGTWRSMAVRDYIKPKDIQENSVHQALRRL